MTQDSSPSGSKVAWHTLSIDDVCKELSSSPSGLSELEASRRLKAFGTNELAHLQQVSPWRLLLEQFQNILIIILLVAIVLSLILGHGVEAIAIGVIILFTVLLGFCQEYRAERAIQALQQMAAPQAKVLRDGSETTIPTRDLVLGDVVLLRAGDKVPADVRLIEAVNLQIEEAVLTGESMPVEKQSISLANPDLGLGDRTNMAYAGTTATYGRGRAMVTATGMQTEFGKIAQMLHSVETDETPLQKNLDKVGTALAKIALLIVVLIMVMGLWRGQPFIEMLIFGIALAVAVVPEALPAVVTISLAIGMQRMVKCHVLMRKLPAVETLGSISVICSDKTGTLTKDEMTICELFVAGQPLKVSGAGYQPSGQFFYNDLAIEPSNSIKRLLQAAMLASDADLVHDESAGRWQIKGDPTEGALIVAGAKAGLSRLDLEARFPRISEIPFTSETKRMTTLNQGPEGVLASSKGAPEVILEHCTTLSMPHGDVTLDAESRAGILEAASQMASRALRVLAVAVKPTALPESAEQGMTFLGLVGMLDPPRPEAQAAIQTCASAGIKTVMITGDHLLTAQAVARELGILQAGRVLSGAELETLSESDFNGIVEKIEVYARVSPAHKLRIVTALKQRGHLVAMTGDGVNDAPALKKADIGIAMGIMGTDVTREAAAMTLTDDNFASIVAAVEEGRGVFENIKKYLMYLLSSNIGEIGLMAGALLAGLPLPLSAVQILYVNLATDGLPALALAVDPSDPGLMRRHPRSSKSGIFTTPVVALMTIGGLWSALINLSLFAWALHSGRIEEATTMTFASLVLIQFFKAYNFRSDRHSIVHRPFSNKWLNGAILWEIGLLLLVIYTPFLQAPFDTFSLASTDWAIVAISALTILPILEWGKWCVRRGWFGGLDS